MELTDRDNNNFWLYYMASEFCWAVDDDAEMMFSDWLVERNDFPSDKWYHDFTGADKEPWDGTTLGLKLNDNITLAIEFHANGTVYFLNDTYIGETGGHPYLSIFRWQEVKAITEGKDYSAFLMLPLVVGKKSEEEEIGVYIKKILCALTFIDDKDVEYITTCLLTHIIVDENSFEEDAEFGIICTRNHSTRNPKSNNNTLEDIQNLNNLIKLAMEQ